MDKHLQCYLVRITLKYYRPIDRGELQACYQVSLYGRKFLLTHPVDMPPHRLAQMVKHPLRHDPNSDVDPLLFRTKQKMANANCSLKRIKYPISVKNIKDFPAYLKITKAVPKGHEVLYNYGAGHRFDSPCSSMCPVLCLFLQVFCLVNKESNLLIAPNCI